MRTIKFRAWHKVDKYWIDHDDLFMSGHEYQNPFTNSDLELMQFTGLLDKNGKEIYEGDLLRFKHASNECEYVLFEDGAFQMETTYKKNGEKLRSWCTQRLMSDFKVVGNIYENPKLLTTKKL